MAPVTRWYCGPIDEIATQTLDGVEHVLAYGEPLECTAEDAERFDRQPENWSDQPVARTEQRPDNAAPGVAVGDALSVGDDELDPVIPAESTDHDDDEETV